MKPVDQTAFGNPDGNCYGAAIASLLEVPLVALPDYVADAKAGKCWQRTIATYLYKHFRLMAIRTDSRITFRVQPKGYCLINGLSCRGEQHATVGLDGVIVHDPHPSRAGLVQVDDYEFLVPVDLDQIADADHRKGMEIWLGSERDCSCPACLSSKE